MSQEMKYQELKNKLVATEQRTEIAIMAFINRWEDASRRVPTLMDVSTVWMNGEIRYTGDVDTLINRIQVKTQKALEMVTKVLKTSEHEVFDELMEQINGDFARHEVEWSPQFKDFMAKRFVSGGSVDRITETIKALAGNLAQSAKNIMQDLVDPADPPVQASLTLAPILADLVDIHRGILSLGTPAMETYVKVVLELVAELVKDASGIPIYNALQAHVRNLVLYSEELTWTSAFLNPANHYWKPMQVHDLQASEAPGANDQATVHELRTLAAHLGDCTSHFLGELTVPEANSSQTVTSIEEALNDLTAFVRGQIVIPSLTMEIYIARLLNLMRDLVKDAEGVANYNTFLKHVKQLVDRQQGINWTSEFLNHNHWKLMQLNTAKIGNMIAEAIENVHTVALRAFSCASSLELRFMDLEPGSKVRAKTNQQKRNAIRLAYRSNDLVMHLSTLREFLKSRQVILATVDEIRAEAFAAHLKHPAVLKFMTMGNEYVGQPGIKTIAEIRDNFPGLNTEVVRVAQHVVYDLVTAFEIAAQYERNRETLAAAPEASPAPTETVALQPTLFKTFVVKALGTLSAELKEQANKVAVATASVRNLTQTAVHGSPLYKEGHSLLSDLKSKGELLAETRSHVKVAMSFLMNGEFELFSDTQGQLYVIHQGKAALAPLTNLLLCLMHDIKKPFGEHLPFAENFGLTNPVLKFDLKPLVNDLKKMIEALPLRQNPTHKVALDVETQAKDSLVTRQTVDAVMSDLFGGTGSFMDVFLGAMIRGVETAKEEAATKEAEEKIDQARRDAAKALRNSEVMTNMAATCRSIADFGGDWLLPGVQSQYTELCHWVKEWIVTNGRTPEQQAMYEESKNQATRMNAATMAHVRKEAMTTMSMAVMTYVTATMPLPMTLPEMLIPLVDTLDVLAWA